MGNRAYFPRRNAILFIGLVALAASAAPARADSTMTLRATVTRGCNVNALPMMFGTIAWFLPNAITQTSILVDCTPNTAFAVAIDNGENPNGGQRRMVRTGPGIGTFLNYEIFRDAGRTQRWGTSIAQVASGVTPANGRVTLTAYGRANGFIASGPFQDTVTVTITF